MVNLKMKFFASVFLLVALVTSALSMTAPVAALVAAPVAAPPKVHIPPKDMRFWNTYYVTDSAGHIEGDSLTKADMNDDVQFVIASGKTFYGRPNTIALAGPMHPDTTFISYAKNGDIWVNHPSKGVKPKWECLEFSLPPGKPKYVKPVKEVFGDLVMYHRRIVEVMGRDTVKVAGKVFDCIKLSNTEIRRSNGVDYTNVFNYWFSPELGYLLKTSYGWNGPHFMYQVLKDYLPK